jgi:hypothetical protein
MINQSAYAIRVIDGGTFELFPDGRLSIRWPHQEPIEISPEMIYALYLLLRMPGIAPQLRRLDGARQQRLWENRYAHE